MGFRKGFTLIEFSICVLITLLLALVSIPAYWDYSTREKIRELSPTKSAEALSSQGEMDYSIKYSGKRISALFLSVNTQLYQGAPCEVSTGRLEKQRVAENYIVAKYAPLTPTKSECPAGVIALTKEDWAIVYTTHLVKSGEYDRQLESNKFVNKRERQREVEKKALDFLKKEGLLPIPNEK